MRHTEKYFFLFFTVIRWFHQLISGSARFGQALEIQRLRQESRWKSHRS